MIDLDDRISKIQMARDEEKMRVNSANSLSRTNRDCLLDRYEKLIDHPSKEVDAEFTVVPEERDHKNGLVECRVVIRCLRHNQTDDVHSKLSISYKREEPCAWRVYGEYKSAVGGWVESILTDEELDQLVIDWMLFGKRPFNWLLDHKDRAR